MMNYRFSMIALLTVCFTFANAQAKSYYVAVDGNDSDLGTKDKPFASISRSQCAAGPGDTIFVRGGRYFPVSSVILTKSGKPDNRICLFAYPGEKPVLNGSKMTSGAMLKLSCASYWHIKGLEICYGPWGIYVDEKSSYNTFEIINTHHHKNPGFYTFGPHNLILNCDSHHNFDSENNGRGADGFAAGYSHSKYNVFKGCRAWQNSDDGYDTWEGANSTFENCWSFKNAYKDDGKLWSPKGDGNGFKLGRGDGNHIVNKCMAWANKTGGFNYNGGKVITLNNCTAWRNDRNYAFTMPTHKLRNCISFDAKRSSIIAADDHKNNSWDLPVTVDSNDFLNMDYALATGPRQTDGSLPKVDFMKLAPDSDLIDKGLDVGLPYHGQAPDLGAYEYYPKEP